MGFMPVPGLVKKSELKLESKSIIILCDTKLTVITRNILEQCLHIAGLTWSDILLINIYYEHHNTYDVYDKKKKYFKIDIAKYKTELYEKLENVEANVIVTLGDAVLATITEYKSSYTWRGSILPCGFLPKIEKIIPTLHPAYCNKAYLDRYKIIADLRRAKNESEFHELRRPKRNLKIGPSLHEALAYLKDIENLPRVSFDIECNGALETSCIAFAKAADDCMCIPFYKAYWSEEEEVIIWRAIARVLEDDRIEKIGQNLMFDIAFLLKKNGIFTRGQIQDTMVAQAILYPEFPKGLDFLCSLYTDEPYYKDEGKIWKNPNLNLKTFWLYNAKDAATTCEIWDVLHKQLQKREHQTAYDETIQLFYPLLFMQTFGVKADLDALAETKAEVEKEILDKQEELDKICGEPLNVNSSKACQKYFYISKNIRPYYEKQKVTTNNKAMQRIARLGFPEAKLVQEIRGLRKLKGTYLDIKFDEDKRLRCSYDPAGTVTGRLSSKQTIFGTGTNFQNIPKSVRKFLIADPGYLLIELDKVQAEWIGVGYISNDGNMIEVAEKGLDAHVKTASLMFGVAPDQVTQELRKKGKVCNHSLNYDMGYKGFALQWGFKEKEAKELVARYHRAYPGIRQWHERVRSQLSSNNRTLYNCFGRPRRFLGRWGDQLFKSAYAYNPQSTIVAVVNNGLYSTYNNPLLDRLYLIGQIHDSIMGEQKYDDIAKFMFMLKTIVRYLDRPIPCNGRTFTIPTEIKVGFNWKDMVTLSKRGHDWEQIQIDLERLIFKHNKKAICQDN